MQSHLRSDDLYLQRSDGEQHNVTVDKTFLVENMNLAAAWMETVTLARLQTGDILAICIFKQLALLLILLAVNAHYKWLFW
jgi:hypothetical protein